MKLLKLATIETYTGRKTRTGVGNESAVVKRNEVCAMEDADAAHALSQHNINRENEPVPYFKDVTNEYEGKIDHDFTADGKSGKMDKFTHTDDIAKRGQKKPATVADKPNGDDTTSGSNGSESPQSETPTQTSKPAQRVSRAAPGKK